MYTNIRNRNQQQTNASRFIQHRQSAQNRPAQKRCCSKVLAQYNNIDAERHQFQRAYFRATHQRLLLHPIDHRLQDFAAVFAELQHPRSYSTSAEPDSTSGYHQREFFAEFQWGFEEY